MNHGSARHKTLCGPPRKDHVLVPITESFYSGAYAAQETWSFNFADLNTVPVEAYNRQRKCGSQHTACDENVFFDVADYTPILPLPTEILNLEPEEWMGCRGTPSDYYFGHVALATPAPTAASRLLMG